MSAKWRALQHRHRYTYSAIVFPQSYVDSLNSFQLQYQSSSKFFTELLELVSLNSVYAQVNHAKKVASAFGDLLANGDEDLVSKASRFYLEVLFCENSQPLHRTLVSTLAKSRNCQYSLGECFRNLCEEHSSVQQGQGKRFCVSRVALSVMGMPKLGYLVDVIRDCTVLVARDIVFSLDSIVKETNEWARPSPIVMEQCQEALSCLYYLLQRFPSKFQEDSSVMEMVVTTILSILKSIAFSRDCYVAAGVSFCASLQVCLTLQELGVLIFYGFFEQTTRISSLKSEGEFRNAVAKVPYQVNICTEIHSFSVLSRICLIRGILTAIPRAVLNIPFSEVGGEVLNDHPSSMISGNSVKTILYDGILPELCNYCENPTDSHFNFHSLTVLQICLQQIKTSLVGNLTNISCSYDPLPEEMGSRILRIMWTNLEDPLSQTVKQVHLIFDLFLEIQSSLCWSEGSEKIKSYLQKIASDLLRLGSRCKGRYVPLASLTKRLGAKALLDMSSSLLLETVQAYIDDDVCCAATSFLKCFLEHLRDECWSSDGIESGYALYRGHCLPPVLYGLASGISKLRSNLNTYALPVLFEIDLDSIFPMLAFISVWPSSGDNLVLYPGNNQGSTELRVEQKVAIFISLLKVSRSLALIEGDIDWLEKPSLEQQSVHEIECYSCHALVFIKGVKVEILVEWLVMALTHVDESLRVDAADFIFLNPKTSSLPSHLELTLLKKAIPLNMRCSSTAFQMKWSSLFRKFFSRVRTALERQFKLGNWIPLASCPNSEGYLPNGSEQIIVGRADDLFHFMKWLSCFLFFSCYPSAPYKRKIMAMDLFLVMLNVWSIVPSKEKSNETLLHPYNEGITSPDSVLLLVGSIIDSWDRLRENSFRILLHFPTPLPGISSEFMVGRVVTWAKKLVCSSRVRESDAGALTLRLLFRKYVLELGWIVRASVDVVCLDSLHKLPKIGEEISKSNHPVTEYLKSLIDWLNICVTEGERNLSEACKNSFVHGVLLALRYTFEELDWNSDLVLSSISEMKSLLEKLLELVMRITSLALWVVSADALSLPEDMDDMVDDEAFLLDVSDEADVSTPLSELEDNKDKTSVNSRTSEQIVMVGCWLAMKEVSLLLGTIIRKVPLPTASDSVEPDPSASIILKNDEVLDLRQLKEIGNHFLEVLLKMKHNGAIDKTRAGFTALCNRLLCSNDPRLCKLTESWMDQLMERTTAKDQTVDDLLRRSAGIPAAFVALFLAEPEGSPKKLLPRALKWLIDVAERLLQNPVETDCKNSNICELPSSDLGQDIECVTPYETYASGKASKIRDEGVIPTVHAFNVLRAAFNDTNLATDTSGFSAQAIIVSIRSFSSSYWEVRNSACLAYTALVRRMIGFLNVHKRESARRALTGLEFFHRYPSLHPFLLDELKVATASLDDGSSGNSGSNLAKVVHPSLCPMLILLSRLKPSTIACETGDDLDPFLFMPFIRRCSSQSNLRIRILASRALTGLVSNEKLPSVILNIASELLVDDNTMMTPKSTILLDVTTTTQHASYNRIHGILLQLISLLDINCRNLADISKKNQVLEDLVDVLACCSWVARARCCSCPILSTSFLQVLGHMLSIARTCSRSKSFYIIRNLLLDLSTDCLDVEPSYELSYYDPTSAELRQQAAFCYFNCVLQPFGEEDDVVLQGPRRSQSDASVPAALIDYPFSQLQERLIRSLQDPCYEVRLSTLKWLFKFLKSTEHSAGFYDLSSYEIRTVDHWIKTNLQAFLTELLALEKNHRCQYYILKNLFIWNMLQFQKFGKEKCTEVVYIGEMDCGSVLQFWDKLVSLYKLTRHAKTRETTIRCMGVCIKRIAVLYSTSIVSDAMATQSLEDRISNNNLEEFYACITLFTDLIRQHGTASEPVNMRVAAADSIIASGLLEQAEICSDFMFKNEIPYQTLSSHFEQKEYVNMYAHQILNIWFTCIMLLEDEDDMLRKELAVDVQKCFSSKRTGTSSNVPNQVDQVIVSSFEYLSSIFGHWVQYFDYLSQWVLNTENYAVSQVDPVRRVFDKEIDNHHEEKLLISQTCCYHLEKLSKSKLVAVWDTEWFISYLVGLRRRFFHQLIKFSDAHTGKHGGFDWIGGAGNHKDAFLPVYANLLGFYALSNCIVNGKSQVSTPPPPLDAEAIEIGKIISSFLRNPLICNLYLLVIRIHKEVKVIDVDRDDKIPELRHDPIWENFDPYFLLR